MLFRSLTSVTLELGGKSPSIVDASANLSLAASNILWAKFTNAGQTCIAPDHVYVHESVKDAWVACCREVLQKAYGESLAEQVASPHLAHMVNARHTDRVKALLEDAKSRGARVLLGGGALEGECFVQPTLLDQLPSDCRLMEEEIFGPLLPVITFRTLDEVIAKINAGPKPLALYIYSQTSAHVNQVLAQTASGGACVNHALLQFLHGTACVMIAFPAKFFQHIAIAHEQHSFHIVYVFLIGHTDVHVQASAAVGVGFLTAGPVQHQF